MIQLTRHQVDALARLLAETPGASEVSLLAVSHSAFDVTLWSEDDQILQTVTVSVGGTIRDQAAAA